MRRALTVCVAVCLTLAGVACLPSRSAELASVGSSCDEAYYYVVEGDTQHAAQASCDEVCSGVICPGNAEARATMPGDATSDDSWKCDCTCGCDDEDAAGTIVPASSVP